MWIGYLCALIVCIVFGLALYGARKEIKELKAERLNLLGDICRLKSELATHVYTKEKVKLTLPEKRIILDALESPQYKARVQEPQTKRFIRIIYNTLKTKIKESIKEAE